MIKTPLSTMIGGAFWTPGATIISSSSQNLTQLIKSQFSDGTQGIYLNAQDALSVSDLSSIKDLSGNNNHALQADSAKRASLITDPSGYKSLAFDGVDDHFTSAINFSLASECTVIAAFKYPDLNSGVAQHLFDFGARVIDFRSKDGTKISTLSRSPSAIIDGGQQASILLSSLTSLSNVVTAKHSIPTDTSILYANRQPSPPALADKGTGTFGSQSMVIGARSSKIDCFSGKLYAMLVIGKLLDDATTQRIEKEFAKYMGITL